MDRFDLSVVALRRRLRVLLPLAVGYPAASALALASLAWTSGRPVRYLFALTAAPVLYLAAIVVGQYLATGWRLARPERGALVVDGTGVRRGGRTIPWSDLRVSVRRTAIPGVVLSYRWRRVLLRPSSYGVGIEELAAPFRRYAEVRDPDAPRRPEYDEPAGTVTFFYDGWLLRALRRRYRSTGLVAALGLAPALVGLVVLRAWLLAVALAALLHALVIRSWVQQAKVGRLLRAVGAPRNVLRLTPTDLTLLGTDVAVPWSHVRGAAVAPDGVTGAVTCTDDGPGHECRWRGRRVEFRVEPSLYAVPLREIAAAFSRHIPVTDV
jgi:hypothetical protein